MNLLRSLVSWIKRRILRDQRERWNHQYTVGRWEYLKGPAEHARLAACAEALRHHAHAGRILEIGCGEALLQRHLEPHEYATWLGVDISEIAIGKAQAFANARVQYVVGEMGSLQQYGPYDAIVFPESIYYSTDPAELLRRCATALAAGGVLIISIFETKRSAKIWQEIHSVTHTVESRATTNELGTWVCEVLRMR